MITMLPVSSSIGRRAVFNNGAAARYKSSRPQSSSLFESASDYVTKLRWKAAQALTANLSPEEREILLKRLNAVDERQAVQNTQKSIGEAVAEARAAEAQRLTHRWEREKDNLMAEAQAAAQARVENDLLIQQRRIGLERWKKELEREEESEKATVVAPNVNNSAEVNDNPKSLSVDEHPILGPVVADFGYKRVYVTSASFLASIPVWEKQRIYRHDRAKAMAADKMKTPHLGLPGVISLHENVDGKLSILDGQHRVGMMAILDANGRDTAGFDLNRILVEVYSQPLDREESHAQDIFLEVNKAEPVKLVDMPGVASSKDRHIITDCAETLKIKFPDMFSPSQSCRAPHLNIDNFRDALFASDAINRHALKSAKALEDWVLKQNDNLKQAYSKKEYASKVNDRALAKAKKFGFYLGLESTWLYN